MKQQPQSTPDAADAKRANRKAKFEDFKKRWHLGSHYTIERFGVISAVALTGTVLFTAGAAGFAVKATNENLADQAIYTTNFASSITQNNGSVSGVYTNTDKTRALVMMKFTTPRAMSAQANDYFVYATGIGDGDTPTKLAQPTVGSIYMFGDSGYMGVLLEAPDGFTQQKINLTVRANKRLSPDNPMTEKQLAENGYSDSFLLNDEWRVVLNPAGNFAEGLETLNAEDIDAKKLYIEAVLFNDEMKLRKDLDESLADLKAAYDRMTTYEEQMADTSVALDGDYNVRLIPPVLPDVISGDELEGFSSSEVQAAYKALETGNISSVDMKLREQLDAKNQRARDMDNAEGYPNTYTVNAETLPAGGFNYDWRNTTLLDGYVDQAIPDEETSKAVYVTSRMAAQDDRFSSRDFRWMLTNGKALDEYDDTEPAVVRLATLASNASQAYADYYGAKTRYMRDLLGEMLLLEINAEDVADATSINTGQTDATVDAEGNAIDINTDGVGVDVNF